MADFQFPPKHAPIAQGDVRFINHTWLGWFTNIYQMLSLLNFGFGSPETVVTGRVGSLFLRLDGGAGTTLYVKESGTGATGWVAK